MPISSSNILGNVTAVFMTYYAFESVFDVEAAVSTGHLLEDQKLSFVVWNFCC